MNKGWQSQQSSSHTLIFIHIPKSAGNSLREILRRQYGYRYSFKVQSDERTKASVDKLRQLPEDRKYRIRLISGHMPFGLHRWLPQPATYITILRNPIERVASEYYYIRRKPIHPDHSELVENNLSLKEFYIDRMVERNTTNLQTRWVSGCADFDSVVPPYEELPANALDLAKQNLEKYFVVCGLTERFDESLLLMQKVLGWGNVYYVKRNVTRRRPQRDELSSSTLRLIEKYEEKDLELFEYAAKRLAEMLDANSIGDETIRWFRTENRLLGPPLFIREVFVRKLRTIAKTMLHFQ